MVCWQQPSKYLYAFHIAGESFTAILFCGRLQIDSDATVSGATVDGVGGDWLDKGVRSLSSPRAESVQSGV